MKMSKEANYGNWVPAAMMKKLWIASSAFCVVTILLFLLVKNKVAGVVGLIVTIVAFCMTFYMQKCQKLFDFQQGGVMGDIHQFLVDHFPWEESRKILGVNDGNGLILDIGCGAAALTNRIAKTYPNARVIGMDYWGPEWSYANYISNIEKQPFVPNFVTAPWMIKDAGLIYGIR